MQFNPDEYETVKSRKEKFYKDHPEGRIIVELVNDNHLDYALFKATCYLSGEDQAKNCPRSTGYALEVRDKELSTSSRGTQYESVNYSSWTENCEESAVGRCLDNAGYSGNKKASREEMQKAQRMTATLGKQSPPVAPKSSVKPICQYHKVEMFKTPNMKDFAHRDEVRGWCNGKGYKDELDAWRDKNKVDTLAVANEFEESL